MADFVIELEHLINRHSIENDSNTPDFILAMYIQNCLDAFAVATRQRDDWHKPTNDEKRIELAGQFQYWLDENERHHSADGTTVEDGMHVIPPNWPTRGVLKEWINILMNNEQS